MSFVSEGASRAPSEHRIYDLRHRKDEPDGNYVECVCGWRQDGPGASDAYDQHRRAAARA